MNRRGERERGIIEAERHLHFFTGAVAIRPLKLILIEELSQLIALCLDMRDVPQVVFECMQRCVRHVSKIMTLIPVFVLFQLQHGSVSKHIKLELHCHTAGAWRHLSGQSCLYLSAVRVAARCAVMTGVIIHERREHSILAPLVCCNQGLDGLYLRGLAVIPRYRWQHLYCVITHNFGVASGCLDVYRQSRGLNDCFCTCVREQGLKCHTEREV